MSSHTPLNNGLTAGHALHAMAGTSVRFYAPNHGSFSHEDDKTFQALSAPDLENLLSQCQQAAGRIRAELEARIRWATLSEEISQQLQELLEDTAVEVSTRHILEGKKSGRVEEAIRLLHSEQSDYRMRRYSKSLELILRHCGSQMFVLCAASWSQKNIAENNEQVRSNLINFIRSEKGFLSSTQLQQICLRLNIPTSLTSEAGSLDRYRASCNESYISGDKVQ